MAAPVPGLPDPGALVRWGLPVVRVVHDVAAAVTVGLLVLAATSSPRRPHEPPGHRHPAGLGRGRRVGRGRAGRAGPVLRRRLRHPLDDPAFGPQFQQFVLSIEVAAGRAISMGLRAGRRRRGVRGPPARDDGRARGAERARRAAARARRPRGRLGQTTSTAVNALAVHLVAVIALGGRPARRSSCCARCSAATSPSASARYSTLAGWCFVARRPVRACRTRWIRLGSCRGPRLAVRRPGPRSRSLALAAARACAGGSSAVAWSTGWPPTRVAPSRSSSASRWSRSS